jgi:hypothetical protein
MKLSRWLVFLAIPGSVGAQSLIHEYSAPSSHGLNTFVGRNSGNRTMAPNSNLPYLAARNTALGGNTLALNAQGFENTVGGANALYANSDGYRNTAAGYVCLASNSTGGDNTALGHSAMYRNSAGVENTAAGLQSLYRNTLGSHNVAIGRDANFSNTTASYNTGIGVDAIPGVETGDGNTGAGGESGYTENLVHQCVTGAYNTWLGYQSGPSSAMQSDHAVGIGYRAKTSKDWQVVLGSPAIVETLLHGNVGINTTDPAATLVVMGNTVNTTGDWGIYSDARLKTGIERFEDGLDVVRSLRPVTFHYNGLEGLPTEATQIGLLAQDVEKVAPYMVSVERGKDIDDARVLSTQALPYLLINAFQDLQSQFDSMQRRVADLESSP